MTKQIKLRKMVPLAVLASCALVFGVPATTHAQSTANATGQLLRRWYGWDYQLSRQQTNHVMLGMAGATAASFALPEAVASKIVGGALAASSGYANWVYNSGGCLKVYIYYIGQIAVGHYYGGACR